MDFIIQKQIHSNIVNKVAKDTPSWDFGDGMITNEKDLGLVAYGADCAIIAFLDNEKIGICHAGWRGLVSGIVDNMVSHFPNGNCHIAPFLHQFEIQKDDCYEKIQSRFGDRYLDEAQGKVIFHFKKAIVDSVSQIPLALDDRSTIDNSDLGSWRRDKKTGDGTQNRLVIYRTETGIQTKLFYPKESVWSFFEQK